MNDAIIAKKYISIISTSLRNFTPQKLDEWNFSCPLCGDSKKDKRKKRGYIFWFKNNYFFKCHNCQVSLRFDKFLEQFDLNLYHQYLLEASIQNQQRPNSNETQQTTAIKKIQIHLKKLSELQTSHIAIQYYNSRGLPSHGKEQLYYTEDFQKFVLNEIKNPKYDKLEPFEKRIVIPYYDFQNNFVGCQGRILQKNSKTRYVTAIMENNDFPLLFGLPNLDYSQTIYVVEGAFDSLLLPNSIAVNTSNLVKVKTIFSETICQKMILIHDHQPRNKEIMKELEKSIKAGFQVVIFPQKIKGKDINEMHLHQQNVYAIIKENTFVNLDAQFRFLNYCRC